MTKYIRIIILVICINSIGLSLFGQFYHFKPDLDTCYCNDAIIMGIKRFDTLTSVVPPKSYRIYDKSQDPKAAYHLYRYATEKRNVHKLIGMRKEQYLYGLFNEDVYIVPKWPNIFYDSIKHCANDSLKKIINEQMPKNYLAPEVFGDWYSIKNFDCIDYRQRLFLVVLMNADFYNKIAGQFNGCGRNYILPEFNENISKGFYVKVLLPFYDDY